MMSDENIGYNLYCKVCFYEGDAGCLLLDT